MKSFKNILIYFFLYLAIFHFCGQATIDNLYNIKYNVEYSTPDVELQKLVSPETSFDEDVSLIFSKNNIQILNSGCQSFINSHSILPSELYFSIWLPPDKS